MWQAIILSCLLLFNTNAFALSQPKLKETPEFPKEFVEPNIRQMIEWIPEEVPRTVSFYFDTDGDGVSDIIIAYHLIEAYACKEFCTIELREFDDHWILVSSIGQNPHAYYIIKKWSLWKNKAKEDWKSVKKSSENVYKYKDHDTWYRERFLKMHPNK